MSSLSNPATISWNFFIDASYLEEFEKEKAEKKVFL